MLTFLADHQEHNLDWFPRMRAMSLVSSDAEGEQNEIRNLQEKLESTMRLVANLSGQLSELKEQVPTQSFFFFWQHFNRIVSFMHYKNALSPVRQLCLNHKTRQLNGG